jgi:predicted house-cleaning noncanonical NTP pyrophosphatase (MazG superfamily)
MMAKLVRDKVPDIIRRSGRKPVVRRISGEELKSALKEKLVEEASELKESGDVYGELADVLEVVDAIISCYGLDRGKLEDAKKKKLEWAGGFTEGSVLSGDE